MIPLSSVLSIFPSFDELAIHTEHLETRRIVVSSQPSSYVRFANLFQMFGSAAIDVVYAKCSNIRETTFGAFHRSVAIMSHNFGFDFSVLCSIESRNCFLVPPIVTSVFCSYFLKIPFSVSSIVFSRLWHKTSMLVGIFKAFDKLQVEQW